MVRPYDNDNEDDEAQDGWGMDDDDVDVEDFDWNDDDGNAAATATAATSDSRVDASHHPESKHNDGDGWNDDSNLLDLSETSRIENTTAKQQQQQQQQQQQSGEVARGANDAVTAVVAAGAVTADSSGWGDDDDFDLNDDDDDGDNAWNAAAISGAVTEGVGSQADAKQDGVPPISLSAQPPTSKFYTALQDYLALLPALTPSISAVLQAEYNTPSKAYELQQYYAERPALAAYTIEKELPRMDCILTDSTGSGDVLDDKASIAQQFALEAATSLCVRCANQSLLADMLQVLTGPDRVIRAQPFHATAVATHCRFRVDLGLGLVEVNSTLDVSLPLEQGRWKVAELRIMILFECGDSPNNASSPPTVDFRLVDIRPTASPRDNDWASKLQQCCNVLDMLTEMEQHDDLSRDQGQLQLNFRDAFLQSQSAVAASASNAMIGMKSAWQDLNAATGLHSKWKQLPTLLPFPDASVWHEADLEQQREQERRLQEMASSRPGVPESAAPAPSVPQTQHRPPSAAPPPPQPQHRPTSILGGLVRSLAKTVALPEEDASLYQDWQTTTTAAAPPKSSAATPAAAAAAISIPRLYNQETPPVQAKPSVSATGLQSHMDNNSTIKSTSASESSTQPESRFPRLYQKPAATPPPPVAAAAASAAAPSPIIPRFYNTETPPTLRKPTVGANAVAAAKKAAPSLLSNVAESHDTTSDGWEDDDVAVDDVQAIGTSRAVMTPGPMVKPPDDEIDLSTWTYDPETDIIPTRKRWVNPRSGERRLFAQ